MTDGESITRWLEELKDDSSTAAKNLWEAYFHRMVGIARERLPREKRRMADEEDVALSAFDSFCRGAKEGRFRQLVNRDGLWPLLVAITLHKAKDLTRHELRQKRGGGMKEQPLWDDMLCREPTPEFTVQLTEQIERLLGALDAAGDPEIRTIVLDSLEGFTTREIAERLNCTMRTVQRKLKIVRRLWLAEDNE